LGGRHERLGRRHRRNAGSDISGIIRGRIIGRIVDGVVGFEHGVIRFEHDLLSLDHTAVDAVV
jgi:hypothetical protein